MTWSPITQIRRIHAEVPQSGSHRGRLCRRWRSPLRHGRRHGFYQSTANSTHEPYNIGLLVKDIDTYYGATLDSNGVYQASKDSQYAKDLSRLESDAKRYIDRAAHKAKHRGEKPAVVFDIDDTLLLSLDYEKKTNYTYNSASWAAYVAQADRPAVFGTPELVAYAESKGVEVFYNSGLKESQRVSAVANLKKVGADINLDADHMFLKDAANPCGLPERLRHGRRLELHHRAVQVRHP